jgi:hypothetical protein
MEYFTGEDHYIATLDPPNEYTFAAGTAQSVISKLLSHGALCAGMTFVPCPVN